MKDQFFENEDLHLMDFARSGNIIGEVDNLRVVADETATPTMGSTVTLNVKKNGANSWLDNGVVVFELSALSGGSGGSYNRFVNAIALYLWQRVEILQNSDIKFKNYPEAVHQNMKYYLNQDKYAALSQQLAIGSTSTRNTLAASAQIVVIPLALLCGLFSKPLDRALFNDELEIKFYLRDNVRHVIQTDHSTPPTFTITNCYLDLEYVTPKQSIINASRLAYIKNGNKGVPQFDVVHTLKTTTVSSSSTSKVVSLPEVTDKSVIDIQTILRASALSNTNDASDYSDTFIAPTSWDLQSSGNYINHGKEGAITKLYYDKVMIPRFEFPGWNNILSGTATGNDFLISFASDHTIENSEYKRYHGARYFSEKDVQLTVNFSSLAAQTDCINIIRHCRRWVLNKGIITFLGKDDEKKNI